MTTITILGGTGYAGSAIAREALGRGHEVVVFSRNLPSDQTRVDGIRYETGSMLDAGDRQRAVTGTDVLIEALAPRGDLDGALVAVDAALAVLANDAGVRFGVVGGFSSLRLAEGAGRMADGDDLPPQFASEARQMNTVLVNLIDSPESLDWFFVSPAANFGSYAPGEAVGSYRVGGDVALFDSEGVSAISGPDFALAVVDEVENRTLSRAQFSVAY